MNEARETTISCEELEPLPRPLGAVAFSAHLAGAFIDVLLFVLVGVILAAVEAMIELTILPQKRGLPLALVGIIQWLMVLLYVASEAMFAMTPGKWMTGVRTRSPDGSPASWRRLLARSVIKCAPLLILGLGVEIANLAYLPTWGGASSPMRSFLFTVAKRAFMLAHVLAWAVPLGGLLALLPRRRTLHDWMTGTAVFYQKEIEGARRSVERGFEVQAAVVVVNEPTIATNIAPVAPLSQNSGQANDPR